MVDGSTPPPGFVLLAAIPQSLGGTKIVRVAIYRKQ
jgi:hypothetical protein